MRRRGIAGLAGTALTLAGRAVAVRPFRGALPVIAALLPLAAPRRLHAAGGQAAPVSAVAAESAIAAGPPLPALASNTLRYTLHYGVLSRDAAVAEATYRIETAAGRYRIATEGKAIGIVAMFYSGTLTQSSEGRIGPGGLQPEAYAEQRGRRPERRLRFDPAKQLMFGIGTPPEVSAPPGTQDRLSVFFQLGLMARGHPTLFRAASRFTLPLASMRRIDRLTFSVIGQESLRIGGEAVEAIRVTVRNEADASDPVFDIWLAPGQSMLPARIRMQEADGKVIDQLLQRAG